MIKSFLVLFAVLALVLFTSEEYGHTARWYALEALDYVRDHVSWFFYTLGR